MFSTTTSRFVIIFIMLLVSWCQMCESTKSSRRRGRTETILYTLEENPSITYMPEKLIQLNEGRMEINSPKYLKFYFEKKENEIIEEAFEEIKKE